MTIYIEPTMNTLLERDEGTGKMTFFGTVLDDLFSDTQIGIQLDLFTACLLS